MTEITLPQAEDYFLKHVGALNNQVPNGDPFVFLCGFVIAGVLVNHSGISWNEFFPAHATYSRAVPGVLGSMTGYFSLKGMGMALTHNGEQHGDHFQGYVVAVEPFINDLRIAVLNLFSRAQTDKVLAAKLYASLNEHPYIRG